jgi:prepilin-type N-terminal cleavage/methylation domain-containing protein
MTTALKLPSRRGGSLIEILISLTILGIISSVVTVAIRRMPPADPADPMTRIADTINAVLASGRPTTLQFMVNGHPALATLNPDGTVIADTVLRVDRFTRRRLGER